MPRPFAGPARDLKKSPLKGAGQKYGILATTYNWGRGDQPD